MSTSNENSSAQPGEYLSFRVGQEEYGIPILRVQEIRGYQEPTRIANSPAYMKGVVNLRGVIVPIVDLRTKLTQPATYDEITASIVLNIDSRVVGIVVDSVSDVIALTAEQISQPPHMTSGLDAGFITGIATVATAEADQRMLILIDIERVIDTDTVVMAVPQTA